MAYYDRIANRWHAVTGYDGGAFKRSLLNALLLDRIGGIAGRVFLELGAGNGYFMPLLVRRYSGQRLRRLVITDRSGAMLAMAQQHFAIDGAEYLRLDATRPFPFEAGAFDLVLATMVFNEIPTTGLRRTLAECHRVLAPRGQLLATVLHPDLVRSLKRRGELRSSGKGLVTMPGPKDLRVPVCARSADDYQTMLSWAGFRVARQDVRANAEVLSDKPGLRKAGNVPVAMILDCLKDAG